MLCKLLFHMMCKSFKRSHCFFRSKRNLKRFFPGHSVFTRVGKHLRSDQEICIPTARDILQPIYVSEITKNFPQEILMPFVSARHEFGEINLLGNQDSCNLSDSQISMDCEENVAEIFAWVYSIDVTEENFPDISDASVFEK